MPSGTWGNYSQRETITKIRGMMELLMEKRCRPVVMKRRPRAPGVPVRRRGGTGVASRRRAAALGG